jgi:molybdopterin synthase catalytic subunit
MQRSLTITAEPLDEHALASSRQLSRQSGAVVTFLGIVRELEGDVPLAALEYESFQKMAEHQFQLLFDALEKRWPIESVRVVHRVGRVLPGEPSLWLEVAAPHRGEAFAAAQWLIDELKRVVPIWKKPIPQP